MTNDITFLITLLNGDFLIRISLKVCRDDLTGDCDQYPLEPENKKQLWDFLPPHVRSCGKIVSAEQIHDSIIIAKLLKPEPEPVEVCVCEAEGLSNCKVCLPF